MTISNPYERITPKIKSIKITKEAFKKMNVYASIVSEIISRDKECVGTLLNYKDKNDNVTRDIYLWKEQIVSSGDGLPKEFQAAYDEAKQKGMIITGLWHSHGNNGVFHSNLDNTFLDRMYTSGENKIVTKEREEHIEHIVEGETIRLFEEGSNKEIRIKGNVNDIKYIKRDEFYVLNSIVVNRNTYSGGYTNPQLHHNYDAEVWIGPSKTDLKKDATRRIKHATLELVDETNNIQLDKEAMVKEVGEKVIFQGTYLKDMPNYKRVLEKYMKDEDAQTIDESAEQDVSQEVPKEAPDITDRINQEQTDDAIEQENEYSRETRNTRTYMGRLEEFYNSLNRSNDLTDKVIAELGKEYAGKNNWLWPKRFVNSLKILKKLKKKSLTPDQKNALNHIKVIIESNRYLKKKHPLVFRDIQRRLNSENSNFYCNLAYWKDRLFYKPAMPKKEKSSDTLEGIVQKIRQGQAINTKELKHAIKDYNGGRRRKAFRSIAKYVGLAALAAALVIFPAKYTPKENHHARKPAAVYTVKEGDNLWNLTKDYLKKNGVKMANGALYKIVDKVAEENGKGKQAEYNIGGKEKKNPHHIKPKQKINFSKKVLNYAKKGGKK